MQPDLSHGRAPPVLSTTGTALISFSLLSRRRDHSAPPPSPLCGVVLLPEHERRRLPLPRPRARPGLRLWAGRPLASPLLTIGRHRCSSSLPGRRRRPLPVPPTTTSSMTASTSSAAPSLPSAPPRPLATAWFVLHCTGEVPTDVQVVLEDLVVGGARRGDRG